MDESLQSARRALSGDPDDLVATAHIALRANPYDIESLLILQSADPEAKYSTERVESALRRKVWENKGLFQLCLLQKHYPHSYELASFIVEKLKERHWFAVLIDLNQSIQERIDEIGLEVYSSFGKPPSNQDSGYKVVELSRMDSDVFEQPTTQKMVKEADTRLFRMANLRELLSLIGTLADDYFDQPIISGGAPPRFGSSMLAVLHTRANDLGLILASTQDRETVWDFPLQFLFARDLDKFVEFESKEK